VVITISYSRPYESSTMAVTVVVLKDFLIKEGQDRLKDNKVKGQSRIMSRI
jgi:hypothetical protein